MQVAGTMNVINAQKQQQKMNTMAATLSSGMGCGRGGSNQRMYTPFVVNNRFPSLSAQNHI